MIEASNIGPDILYTVLLGASLLVVLSIVNMVKHILQFFKVFKEIQGAIRLCKVRFIVSENSSKRFLSPQLVFIVATLCCSEIF